MTPEQCEPVAVLHGTANSLPSRRRRSFQPRRSEWARCGSLLWMRLVWTTWRATRPVPSGLGGWSAGERGLPGPPLALAGARRGLRCGRRACHGRARCSTSHRGHRCARSAVHRPRMSWALRRPATKAKKHRMAKEAPGTDGAGRTLHEQPGPRMRTDWDTLPARSIRNTSFGWLQNSGG